MKENLNLSVKIPNANERMLSRAQAERLLAVLILTRSTAYIFSKSLLSTLDTFQVLSLRFLLASLLLLPLLFKHSHEIHRETVIKGMILGILFFFVMASELNGLKTMPTSVTAFIENTAIIFVPIFHAVLMRRLPEPKKMFFAGVALLGVGLLTLDQKISIFSSGVLWCLTAAILYAAAILATKIFSESDSPAALGIIQIITLGVLAEAAAILSNHTVLPEFHTDMIFPLLFLSIVCTGFGFTLQPVAQSGTTAERAGLYCALNPVFAALIGHLFLGESLGIRGITGTVLILLCLFLSKD